MIVLLSWFGERLSLTCKTNSHLASHQILVSGEVGLWINGSTGRGSKLKPVPTPTKPAPLSTPQKTHLCIDSESTIRTF